MEVIDVRVITNAKKNDVSDEGDRLRVRVTAPAVSGKANKATIETLAEFFKVKKGDIRIVRGKKSREKVIEVNT